MNGLMYVVFAVLFWSFDGVLIKSVPWTDGIAVNTGRSFFSFAALCLVFRNMPRRVSKKILVGAAVHIVFTLCFVLACVWGPAANAVVLACTSPVFSAVAGRIGYGTKPPHGFAMAFAGVVSGVVLMNWDNFGSLNFAATVAGLLIGISGGVWGVLCRHELEREEQNQSILLSCLVQALPVLYYGGQLGSEPLPFTWGLLLCLFLLGAFIGGASTCFARAATLMDPSLALLLGNAQAPLMIFWVWLVIGEFPTDLELAGGIVVFMCSLWVGWREYRRGETA